MSAHPGQEMRKPGKPLNEAFPSQRGNARVRGTAWHCPLPLTQVLFDQGQSELVPTSPDQCGVGAGGKAPPDLRRGFRAMFGVTGTTSRAGRPLGTAMSFTYHCHTPPRNFHPLNTRQGLHHAGAHAARVLTSFPELIPSYSRHRRHGEPRHPERAGSWPTPELCFKAEKPHGGLPWQLNSGSVPTCTPGAGT